MHKYYSGYVTCVKTLMVILTDKRNKLVSIIFPFRPLTYYDVMCDCVIISSYFRKYVLYNTQPVKASQRSFYELASQLA